VHDDTELMAAIGRMVVNAAELEYAVAELAATAEGLRGEECRERATAIVRRTGEAMRQFERVVQERPDLGWLMRDTASLLGARHFVAHVVPQQDAVAEGDPVLPEYSIVWPDLLLRLRACLSGGWLAGCCPRSSAC
jgi:hypothetical protein